MPRRRYSRSRRTGRRRNTVSTLKRRPNYTRVRVGNLRREIAKLKVNHNVEYKTIDALSHTTQEPYTGAPVITCLNQVARGDDYNERVGRSIKNVSVQLDFDAYHNTTDTATFTVVRWILLIDKEANGAVPVTTDLLTAENTTAFRNLTNRRRFIILKDGRLHLDNNRESRTVKYFKHISLKTIFNSGDNGTVADIDSGSLILILISNAASDKKPLLQITSRVRFIDD